ncbi:MAG TPA: hypothetical protein V6C81_12405 [Planktothrix sp.]|jgi:hypothetical protein
MEAQKTAYRGKHFSIPTFSKEGGVCFQPETKLVQTIFAPDSPIVQTFNQPYDLKNFQVARKPLSLGILPPEERLILAADNSSPRTLDMPIKFPYTDVRVPPELAAEVPIIKRACNAMAAANRAFYDACYLYYTLERGMVIAGNLQREAPCHVDGFQGARWHPKHVANHTITVSNAVPTAYYVQPFDFDLLDVAKHDFYWEMNYQVQQSDSQFAWLPEDCEMTMMDGYTVHRGTATLVDLFRKFMRLSWETRIFDRLGNAHNPLFDYEWEMVPRDIEALNLVAFHADSDPSLRVFPHQNLDGSAKERGTAKTQPNLRKN